MPLYHFRMAKGPKIINHKRVELADAAAAQRHAETLARGLTAMSADFGGLRHLLDWRIEVTDARGKPLAQCEVPHARERAAAPDRATVTRRQHS